MSRIPVIGHNLSMDIIVFKSPAFWAASISAFLGVLLSQHVVVDGSAWATAVGWILTFIGAGGAGHQVASAASRVAS